MLMTTLIASALLANTADDLTAAKIIDATLFKNGYAVVIRQVTVPSSGTVLVKEPPEAVLGTLWIYGDQGGQIKSVVAGRTPVETEYTVNASSVADALRINKGKVMDITWYDQKEWRVITGKVLNVSEQLVVIEENSGQQMFVSLTSIASFKGNKDLVWTEVRKATTDTPILRIQANPGSKVNIMAMQAGMTWSPSYMIDISDEKKLKITGKATIINDLGVMENITARLVTGFPNMNYIGQWDPLTAMLAVVNYPAGGSGGGGRAAPMQNQAVMGRREMSSDSAFGSFVPSTGEGFSGEDLFFLPIEKVMLKQGERGYFALFQADSPFKHLYTLDLPGSLAERGGQDFARTDLDIWHELEFDNNTKMPWSTGPSLIVKNGQMLGQDELKYTTPGTKVNVKITKALDIAAEAREEEIERERGVLKDRYNNPTYDLVTVKGTIELTNLKASDVDMRIRKSIEGEVIEAPGSASSFKSTKRLNQVNINSVIEWRPSLKKGEKVTFTYTYKVYTTAR